MDLNRMRYVISDLSVVFSQKCPGSDVVGCKREENGKKENRGLLGQRDHLTRYALIAYYHPHLDRVLEPIYYF